jgi:tRNA A-37 threonylcarbamoyl transferase component Bud32
MGEALGKNSDGSSLLDAVHRIVDLSLMPEELQPRGVPDLPVDESPQVFDLLEIPGIRLKSVISSQSAESDVWLGELEDRTQVAVKIYRHGRIPGLMDDQKKRSLQQANLLPVLKTGEVSGRYFEVSPFVSGPTLAQLFSEKRTLTESDAVSLVRQLGDAIHYLHAELVLHRDVKPSNIFVTSREPFHLMLADFGTARLTAFQTMLTGSVGTVAYSSPEALTGLQSEASDYWSVGIILMEALTGRQPFEGIDLKQQIYRVVSGQIEIPEGIPAHWERLLRGLLTADYTQRWRKKEIEAWLRSDESSVGKPSKGKQAKQPVPAVPIAKAGGTVTEKQVADQTLLQRFPDQQKVTVDEAFEVLGDFFTTYFARYFWVLFILPAVTRNSPIGWWIAMLIILLGIGSQFTPSALERHRRRKRVNRQLDDYTRDERKRIEEAAEAASDDDHDDDDDRKGRRGRRRGRYPQRRSQRWRR